MKQFEIAQQLYIAYFGRPADAKGRMDFGDGLANLLPEISSIEQLINAYRTENSISNVKDRPVQNLLKGFSESPESMALYNGTTEAFVRAVYNNVLGRVPAADDGGVRFWIDAIDNRGLDRSFASLEILFAALRDDGTPGQPDLDRIAVLNKTQAAQSFTDLVNTPEGRLFFAGSEDAAMARQYLNQINSQTRVDTLETGLTGVVESVLTETLTLEEALNLAILPQNFNLQPSTFSRDAGVSTVAGLNSALSAKAFNAAEQRVVNSALNAQEVKLDIAYSLKDSLVNLVVAPAAVLTGADAYTIDPAQLVRDAGTTTVAGLSAASSAAGFTPAELAVVRGATNSQSIVLDITYVLKDSLANLVAAPANVLQNAESYLIDPASFVRDAGTTTVAGLSAASAAAGFTPAELAVIRGAANSQNVALEITYILKDSLAKLVAAPANVLQNAESYLIDPASFVRDAGTTTVAGLSAASAAAGFTPAELAVIRGAANSQNVALEITYILKDSLANLVAAPVNVLQNAESYLIDPASFVRDAGTTTVAGLSAASAAAGFTPAELAVIRGAANSQSVVLEITYILKDSLANLVAAPANVLQNADSYLIDPATLLRDAGTTTVAGLDAALASKALTSAEQAIINGSANKSEVILIINYSLADNDANLKAAFVAGLPVGLQGIEVQGPTTLQFLDMASAFGPNLRYKTIQGRELDFFKADDSIELSVLGLKFVRDNADVVVLQNELSAAQANVLAAATGGQLTAAVSGSIAELTSLEAGNNFALRVIQGKVNAADLLSLNEIQAVNLDASGVAEIQGTAAEIDSLLLLASESEVQLPRSYDVIVIDEVSLSQLTKFDRANGNGAVEYSTIADTAGALEANTAGYVRGAVDVEVTDGVTLAELASIDALSTGTLTYARVADQIGNILGNAGGYILPGTELQVIGAATIAQLSSADALNGIGNLSYVSIADTPVSLISNVGGYVRDGVDVTITGNATLAQIAAVDALNGDGTLGYAVSDSAANLFGSGTSQPSARTSLYVRDDVLVSTPSQLTVAQANALALLTTGKVSAIVTGSPAQLRALEAGNNWNISLSGAISADDLLQIDARTLLPVNASGVTSVTGTTAQLFSLLSAFGNGINPPANFNVSVSGATTVQLLDAIDSSNGTGSIAYSAITDTANEIANPNGTNVNTFVKPTTNVTIVGEATVAQLRAITSANALGVLSYASITDTAVNLTRTVDSMLVASEFVVAGTSIKVVGASNLVQLAAVDSANGNGALGFDLIVDTSANFFATGATASSRTVAYVNGAVNVQVTNAVNVAQANALASRTEGSVSATVNGSVQELLSLEPGARNFWGLTVTSTVNAGDLLRLDGLTQLAVNARGVTSVTGTAEQLSDLVLAASGALTNGAPTILLPVNFAVNFTTPPSIQQLELLNDINGTGALNYSSISDFADEIVINRVVSDFVLPATDVTVLGAATIDQLALIQAELVPTPGGFLFQPPTPAGDLTYSAISDTAAALIADASSADPFIQAGISLNVLGPVALGQLASLDTANGNAALTYSGIRDVAGQFFTTGDNLTLNASTYLAGASNVTVSQTSATGAALPPISVAQANALAMQTNGVVNAAVSGTLPQLLTLEAGNLWQVSASGVVSAKDLLMLDSLTGSTVNASAVTSITGSAGELGQLLSAFSRASDGISQPVVFDTFLIDFASISLLNAISNTTFGSLTYLGIRDFANNIVSTDGVVVSGFVRPEIKMDFLDSPTLDQLDGVNAVLIEDARYSGVRDTLNNLFVTPESTVLSGQAVTYITADKNLQVTEGSLKVAQFNPLDGRTSGVISAEIADSDIASLLQLTGTGNSLGITVADVTLTLDELNIIGSKTVRAVTVDGRYNDQSQKFAFGDYAIGDLIVADGDGDDLIQLGFGNDTVIAGPGADLIDAGAGSDTVSYQFSDAAVQIDLVAGEGRGGAAQGDVLIGVENLVGTSFADTFVLDQNANKVTDSGTAVLEILPNSFIGFDTVLNFNRNQDSLNFTSPNKNLIYGSFGPNGEFTLDGLGDSTLIYAENDAEFGLQSGELGLLVVGVRLDFVDLIV